MDARRAATVGNADLRAWARDNGWPELGGRGRIPPEVRAAFEEAHGAAVDVDEDDLSALDESGLDEDEEAWSTEEYMTPGQPEAPPATLDEARERAGRDPEPAHLTGTTRRRGQRKPRQPASEQPAPKVTKAIRDDITGKVAFWLMLPAEPWMRVDPYCGGEYANNVDQIAVKLAPILCLSPQVVQWFTKSSVFFMWTELLMACRPVAEAVIAHHVTRRIAINSQGEPVENPRGGMDFSAYSSRQPNPAAASAAA
jgi:hypothetical protein